MPLSKYDDELAATDRRLTAAVDFGDHNAITARRYRQIIRNVIGVRDTMTREISAERMLSIYGPGIDDICAAAERALAERIAA